MENICETERLNCIRNEMTHLWGGVFATAGGSIALFLSEPTFIKYLIGFIGILFLGLFLMYKYMKQNRDYKL